MKKESELLFKITKILDDKIEFKYKLESILNTAAKYLDILLSHLVILNKEKKDDFIKISYGLSNVQQNYSENDPYDEFIEKVIQTKSPIVTPEISVKPEFLNSADSRIKKEKISFICVPIIYHDEIFGALSAFKLFSDENFLEQDVKLLSLIAFMISEEALNNNLERQKQYQYILQLKDENEQLREKLKEKYQIHNIIGNSKEIQEICRIILKLKEYPTIVLLLGESGVGKELVANSIHFNGLRNSKPFVKFNCSAMPENLIESELFGQADMNGKEKKGKFELANHGTIFLDEIGDLPLNIQLKILRVIQEKKINPIGIITPVEIDAAIIASSSRYLEELINEKKFREDLYYRLSIFPILIPPLRKRKTDIPLLIDYFIEKYSIQYNKKISRISTPAIDMLMLYHWPGNVRDYKIV